MKKTVIKLLMFITAWLQIIENERKLIEYYINNKKY